MFTFRELFDLTLPITTGMDIPPGLRRTTPPVEFKVLRNHAEHKIQVGLFSQPIHAGTHVDAPLHIFANGKNLDQLDLRHFLGEGYVVDCSMVGANEPVTAAHLERAADQIKPGMIVLIYTGWSDKMFGKPEYWLDSPYLADDAAQWLVDKGVKIAGYDFFQDRGAKSFVTDTDEFTVHKILLGHEVLNIEHLTNLKPIVGSKVFVIALPLKIKGAEGAPARVVALR
ncbi:MAG TPA: cyclase family protein [Firmicutes bacterium]|nr:cyclase family protein [Bacillota bacterium]